jgi:hypothetical protein
MWKSPPKDACATCHDPENSVPFQKPGAYEDDFLPLVNHHDVPEAERTVWTPPPGPASGPPDEKKDGKKDEKKDG